MSDARNGRPMIRRAMFLAFVAVMALSPAAALAMSHCPAMMSAACLGPCASYACASSPVPPVQALVHVEDTVAVSAHRAPDALLGTPDPPPRPLSFTA